MYGMGGKPKPLSEVMFTKFDKDGSGSIDSSEFSKLCFDLGYALTSSEVQIALKQLDSDGSGKIELPEFKSWWAHANRWKELKVDDVELAKRQKLSDCFLDIDVNKTGFVHKSSFGQLHAALHAAGLTNQSANESAASWGEQVSHSDYTTWWDNQK